MLVLSLETVGRSGLELVSHPPINKHLLSGYLWGSVKNNDGCHLRESDVPRCRPGVSWSLSLARFVRMNLAREFGLIDRNHTVGRRKIDSKLRVL